VVQWLTALVSINKVTQRRVQLVLGWASKPSRCGSIPLGLVVAASTGKAKADVVRVSSSNTVIL